MKVDDATRLCTRVFLDTAPVIYAIEGNAKYGPVAKAWFAHIDAGGLVAVTSPVTLVECLVVPHRLGRGDLIQSFIDRIVHGRSTTFLTSGEAAALRAAEMRANYNLSLPDALQVGAALAAGCDGLLTNDAGLRRVQELSVLVLDDMEL